MRFPPDWSEFGQDPASKPAKYQKNAILAKRSKKITFWSHYRLSPPVRKEFLRKTLLLWLFYSQKSSDFPYVCDSDTKFGQGLSNVIHIKYKFSCVKFGKVLTQLQNDVTFFKLIVVKYRSRTGREGGRGSQPPPPPLAPPLDPPLLMYIWV